MAEKITVAADGTLNVPDEPIIPFIEGDGTGVDIWPATQLVLDAAAAKFGKKIAWMEVLAGEKAFNATGEWLPDATTDAFREYLIGIKGPLTTPVGGGIRSLNVALRQILDLYVCLRPVRYFAGVPSPVKRPEAVDMVIFRENTEDIYAGIEFVGGPTSPPSSSTSSARPSPSCSPRSGSARRPRPTPGRTSWPRPVPPARPAGRGRAGHQAGQPLGHRTPRVLGHRLRHQARPQVGDAGPQGQHHEVHRGRVPRLGLRRRQGHYGAVELDGGPWMVIPEGKPGAGIVIKDVIADAFLQQILTRAEEYDVIATLNLNGDYISDALAAEVGGIGIAPGANINYVTGHGIFEATHGTAPKYAGQDKVNPGSLLLSGVLMFEHLGWNDAADAIVAALEQTISEKIVTYDFARMLEGANEVSCSAFAQAIADRL